METREGVLHNPAGVGDVIVPMGGVSQDGSWQGFPLQGLLPLPFVTGDVAVPAVNTDAVLTYAAAGTNSCHVVSGFVYSYNQIPAGGRLLITDGGDTMFDIDETLAGRFEVTFNPPRQGKPNQAMVVTLPAGGSGCQGKLNCIGHWVVTYSLAGFADFANGNNSGLILLFF